MDLSTKIAIGLAIGFGTLVLEILGLVLYDWAYFKGYNHGWRACRKRALERPTLIESMRDENETK